MTANQRKHKRWSQREDAVLASGVQTNMPYEEIGSKIGRTASSVAQRAYYLRNRLPPAKKVAPAPRTESPRADPAPKAPEMPDTMMERVLEAERMVQQIPMLTLIAGAGAMMSFTTLVIVILALFA